VSCTSLGNFSIMWETMALRLTFCITFESWYDLFSNVLTNKSTDVKMITAAAWGKFAAEILSGNWDGAMEELNKVKELINERVCVLLLFS
jgi:hypothetical protein